MNSTTDGQYSLTLGGNSQMLQETLVDESANSFALVGTVPHTRVTELEKTLERMASGFSAGNQELAFTLKVLQLWMFSQQASTYTLIKRQYRARSGSLTGAYKVNMKRTGKFRRLGWRVVYAIRTLRLENTPVHLGRQRSVVVSTGHNSNFPFLHDMVALRIWNLIMYGILLYSFVRYSML